MSPYRAKKRLGQNFLISEIIINQIVDEINPQAEDNIIEIGPGRGSLTLKLAESGARVIAIEYDHDLIGYLKKLFRKKENVKIINQDFLTYQPSLKKFKLLGNLPYNLTSPIINWTIKHRTEVVSALFMLQKEVAERVSSNPGSKDWSPLAIFTQLFFEVSICFIVSKESFSPSPKVSSAVIKLVPKKKTIENIPQEFEQVVRAAFKQRRKLLVNNLAMIFKKSNREIKEIVEATKLPPKVRAEQVTTGQFLKLTELLKMSNIL